MRLICRRAASVGQPLSLPVCWAGEGKWQLQAAVVCVAKEADQQCELEGLSNWQGTHLAAIFFIYRSYIYIGLYIAIYIEAARVCNSGGSMLCGEDCP